VFTHVYRDVGTGDVLVVLLLFFLGENLHGEMCVWLIMEKWDAIDGRAFKSEYV